MRFKCSSSESASASVTRAPLWSPSMKKKSGFHPRPLHQLRAQIPLENPVHNCQLHEQRLGLATHRRAASARQTARQPGVHHGAAERIPHWWRPTSRPVLLREASSGSAPLPIPLPRQASWRAPQSLKSSGLATTACRPILWRTSLAKARV